MENIASIKRKILITVLAMIVSGLSLISSTFAWYTIAATSTTEVFDLTVGSSMSLQISMDEDGEYKYKLNISDMSAYLDKLASRGENLWVLAPVSTVTCEDFFAPNFINVEDPIVSSFRPVTADSGKYLELPIYLKSTKDVDVYLSEDTKVIVKEPKALATEGEVDRTIRVGFRTSDGTVIFEPNDATDMVGRTQNSEGQPGEGYAISSASPLTYAPQLTHESDELFVAFDGSEGEEATLSNTDASTKTKLATLTAGEAKRISIYLWIEGTDWDCVNDILESTLKVDLKFIGVLSES